jgi:hypothetical protein
VQDRALRVHAELDLPRSVPTVEAQPGFDHFEVFGEPLYRLYAFFAPRTPHLDVLSRQMLPSMVVICNVIWDLPRSKAAAGITYCTGLAY